MRSKPHLIIISALLVGLTAPGYAAQELEVVSVRESGGEPPQLTFQPGRMVWAGVPLETLVSFVFGLSPAFALERQIEGWPDRDLRRRRFTLTATYSGTSTPPFAVQQRLVRQILEGRFGMQASVKRREDAVYALRLIKPGVLGSGIVKVDYDCSNPETRARKDVDCRVGDRSEERGDFIRGSGPIRSLVARLQSEFRDRRLVDQTGLDGFYRWELLRWERAAEGLPRPAPPPLLQVVPVQLGMKIEDARALVDFVVIEAISMPTPN